MPIILKHAVVFPGYGGSRAVVVDTGTWTVAATPNLGRATAGSQSEFDGHSIYIPTADHHDLLVVDPSTYIVTDTIEPLGNNAVATYAGPV